MTQRDILKEVRKQMGMNQNDFADYFGIPHRTMQDWERINQDIYHRRGGADYEKEIDFCNLCCTVIGYAADAICGSKCETEIICKK